MQRVFTANLHGAQQHNGKAVVQIIKRTQHVRFSEQDQFPDQLTVKLECGAIITLTENLVYNSKN